MYPIHMSGDYFSEVATRAADEGEFPKGADLSGKKPGMDSR